MVTLRAARIGIAFIMLFGLVLCDQTEATNPSSTRSDVAENKFLGHWSSHIIYASGEVSDGAFDISDVLPASANRVSVVHSLRGGPFTGYTMSYPDRIGERFFVTGDRQSHHGHKRSASNGDGSFDEVE